MSQDEKVPLTDAAKEHEKKAEEGKKALDKANAEAKNWHAYCQKCGRRINGTLTQLKAHRC